VAEDLRTRAMASSREQALTLRQRLRRMVGWLSVGGFIAFTVLVAHHPVGTQAASPTSSTSAPSGPPSATPEVPTQGFFNGANQYQVQTTPAAPPPMVMSRVS